MVSVFVSLRCKVELALTDADAFHIIWRDKHVTAIILVICGAPWRFHRESISSLTCVGLARHL